MIHEKHEKHEKTILLNFSCFRSFPSSSSRRYTQVSARHRRSGRDAGTQAQGCETIGWDVALIKHVSISELPSMALDTGIHAGMTTLKHTCV